MTTKCKLCRRPIDGSALVRCRCGWAMDEACDGDHHSWCPTGPGERWVGTQEI